MSIRQQFLNHVAQTSELSLGLEVSHAEGMYIYTNDGKKYLDLNSGISVSSLGHRHPKIIKAIKDQLDKHMHTMVYGEHIQKPQVKFATTLAKALDCNLDNVYFVNSGSEAVEVAIKLARKYKGRNEIISCAGAYHGSTLGAESLRSDYEFTRHFMPGIPGVSHIEFNNTDDLSKITKKTACVITEPIQAESGVISPKHDYLKKLQNRCKEVGALFILDEIQTGFGRTGYLYAFQKYGVVPDVLLTAKAMGGGMPIGAIVSSKHIFEALIKKPALGHITTFGGHPVCVAAAHAALEILLEGDIIKEVSRKEAMFKNLLVHPIIKEVRSDGLMMAVELTKRKYLKHVVNHTIEQGALIDYFLFDDKSFRLAPPLIINDDQIQEGCRILLKSMNYAVGVYN